jgi:two-component system sensor histidine kinase QseC
VTERVQRTLSQRLLVGLIVVTFAYWAVIAALTVRDSVDEVYELFDVHLVQTALALLRVTDPDDTQPALIPNRSESPALREIFNQWPELPARLAQARSRSVSQAGPGGTAPAVVTGSIHSMHAEYEKNLRYQVLNGEGVLLLRSTNAPSTVMTTQDGYSQSTDADGQVWRHYGVWDQHHDFRILVSEAHELRNRLVRNIALHVASPLALGMPVLIALLWFSITRGLNPLGKLTRELASRKSDNLIPLDASSAPGEVRPMVQALNQLLHRMTATLEGERRFTANAAHELRTPLAAIQAQLYVARAADNAQERQQALDQLQRGVERGIRLVGQLLTLARLDPEQALPEAQELDLAKVAENVCAEMAPLALQREQTLELDAASDLPPLQGNADLLSMLLCNLMDNAIRYTPRGGRIDVSVSANDAGLALRVSDNGPGIPAAQRERVFDRFYRIAGQDQPGTGLGLAICRRIVELHKAHIVLSEGQDGRGVCASVIFSSPAIQESPAAPDGSLT